MYVFPISCILTQDRYLPLRYAPIVIELEICNLQTEPIVEPSGDVHTAAKTSTNWQIENVKVFADTIMLDNELDNQFAEHLLSGKKQFLYNFLHTPIKLNQSCLRIFSSTFHVQLRGSRISM